MNVLGHCADCTEQEADGTVTLQVLCEELCDAGHEPTVVHWPFESPPHSQTVSKAELPEAQSEPFWGRTGGHGRAHAPATTQALIRRRSVALMGSRVAPSMPLDKWQGVNA